MLPPMAGGTHRHERSQTYRPDAGEPALRRKDPVRRFMPRAGGARQDALPHARRRKGIRRHGPTGTRAGTAFHGGCDRRAEAGSGVVGGGAEVAEGDEAIGYGNISPARAEWLSELLDSHRSFRNFGPPECGPGHGLTQRRSSAINRAAAFRRAARPKRVNGSMSTLLKDHRKFRLRKMWPDALCFES